MKFDLLEQVERNLAAEKISIVEFAESPSYCNKQLYPRQRVLLKLIFLEDLEPWEDEVLDHWIAGGHGGEEIEISPDIRERVAYLKEMGFSHFREVVLVGGRRSSKGFITGIALAYVLWNTLQLQDPGEHYGIPSDKEIYFSCVAGSEDQAKEFQFSDFSNTVESCDSFAPFLTKTLETEMRISTNADLAQINKAKRQGFGKRNRDIARLRGKALAANAGTLRGSATMAMCIDEMAHMLEGDSKGSAAQVYDAAEPAMDQFGSDAILFCNSSPYSKVGRFYERYLEGLLPFDARFAPGEVIDPEDPDTVNGNPLMITFRFPSWALFEGYQGYKTTTGHIFKRAVTVSPDWDPDELDENGNHRWSLSDRQRILIARNRERTNPEAYKVERRGRFAEVVDAYLNPDMVDRIFRGRLLAWDDDDNPIFDNFHESVETAINSFSYKFHLDPSSTTAGFGFAIAHVEKVPDPIVGPNGEERLVDHVVFDLIKRWDPKNFPGQTIQWQTVIDEIIFYARIYRPYEITFDQFQSQDPIQSLRIKLGEIGLSGIMVDTRQPTNTEQWLMWENFKTAINHELVHASKDPTNIDPYGPDQELKFLQKKNTGGNHPRVDKQAVGPVQTKDMADCMAECVMTLIGNVVAQQVRERAINAVTAVGSPGGYSIGGHDADRPALRDLHPELGGYYGSSRHGEQRIGGTSRSDLVRGRVGGNTRRTAMRSYRSRGRR
jgi:hypothetical protein